MGEEFKDFEVEAPVLTLEPDLTEEKEEIAAKEPEKPQEPAVEEPVLSPKEQKIVEDFAAKIDIENTNQILQYGAGTQKKMADFSGSCCNHPSINPDQLLHHRVFIWRNHLFWFLHSCTASFQNTSWNGRKLFCGPVCHRLH